jgi:hypothetical protein
MEEFLGLPSPLRLDFHAAIPEPESDLNFCTGKESIQRWRASALVGNLIPSAKIAKRAVSEKRLLNLASKVVVTLVANDTLRKNGACVAEGVWNDVLNTRRFVRRLFAEDAVQESDHPK